jgi:hypothetical protein
MDTQISPALGAMLAQLAPVAAGIMDRIQPLLDQPVIRFPYNIPLAASQVIDPGATAVLTPPDFNYSFEWPFEIREISFSNDPAHTFRDWRVAIQDQTFNQPWQKGMAGTLVSTLVDTNTSKYCLKFPWIVRPKGGGINIAVTNLDTVNPITVDINFIGSQLLPR